MVRQGEHKEICKGWVIFDPRSRIEEVIEGHRGICISVRDGYYSEQDVDEIIKELLEWKQSAAPHVIAEEVEAEEVYDEFEESDE